MLRKLWNDENGFVISSELILVATVMVIGLLVGMVSLRDQVVQELGDVADALSELSQTYSYAGTAYHADATITSLTAGSYFTDTEDFCDNGDGNANRLVGAAPNCIGLDRDAMPEGS